MGHLRRRDSHLAGCRTRTRTCPTDGYPDYPGQLSVGKWTRLKPSLRAFLTPATPPYRAVFITRQLSRSVWTGKETAAALDDGRVVAAQQVSSWRRLHGCRRRAFSPLFPGVGAITARRVSLIDIPALIGAAVNAGTDSVSQVTRGNPLAALHALSILGFANSYTALWEQNSRALVGRASHAEGEVGSRLDFVACAREPTGAWYLLERSGLRHLGRATSGGHSHGFGFAAGLPQGGYIPVSSQKRIYRYQGDFSPRGKGRQPLAA